MPETRLRYLLERYFYNLATSPETDELMELIAEPENEQAIQHALDEGWGTFLERRPVFAEDRSQAILDGILSAHRAVRQKDDQRSRWRRIPVLWGRMTAAASVLIILGGGMYYYYHYYGLIPARAPAASGIQHSIDIPAGHAGAVLTLASGQRITLDSARNGKLASQGAIRLMKQGAALAYQGGRGTAPTVAAVLYNTITTGRGRKYQLVLSDGTKVWLNAASSIRFPTAFTGKERKVTISGEAYLEVSANPSMPFTVQTVHSETRVLGTSFDVMDYPDEPHPAMTLVAGSVKIVQGTNQVVLSPGEQARLNTVTGKISAQAVDTDPIIAWTKDQLALGSTDLVTLMRQLSRWYDVDITFQGPVPDIRIWGMLDRNVNLSVVLRYMEGNGMRYKIEGKTVVILP